MVNIAMGLHVIAWKNYISAIQTLRDKPELVSQMGDFSFELAKDEFDINATRMKWLNLYKGEY